MYMYMGVCIFFINVHVYMGIYSVNIMYIHVRVSAVTMIIIW